MLAIIALGWTLADKERTAGRLPKYNQERAKRSQSRIGHTYAAQTSMRLAAEGAPESAAWAETAATKTKPTKSDQDQLDACICLASALHFAKGRDTLFVGCRATGYIVVPDSEMLRKSLSAGVFAGDFCPIAGPCGAARLERDGLEQRPDGAGMGRQPLRQRAAEGSCPAVRC